ncbi:MAG: phage terminase large subunit [Patescibacteria group bacterium]|nr:phage terminase large subunit [Patescibacteria group bacterium]
MADSAIRRVELTPALVESFAGIYLSPMYDNPAPVAEFHRQGWGLCCSAAPLGTVAAPRGHAKSTAFTHAFGLATVCFRAQDFVVVVSATEDLAMGHLGDMAKQLRENDELRRDFKILKLSEDSKTSIVVDFEDGHQAKLIAKGSGQKMRGLKWNGKRPGLILGDDLEEDEQVENLSARRKFRKWFNRALLPCLRKGGIARIYGTIMHADALLARLQRNSQWASLIYKAHQAFDDFRNILWPEMFSEEDLRAKRRRYIEDDDAPGYSQEYLNTPLDDALAFLGEAGFLPMEADDWRAPKRIKIGCDFAVSKATLANRTSFTVGGETPSNDLCIYDQRVGRWDTEEWIKEMFSLQIEHDPAEWVVEGGVIWNAVWPTIKQEMRRRGIWMNFNVINPVKDKAARALAFKKRHRAGGMRYAADSQWYEEYKAELKMFTGATEAISDDQFDSTAILVKGFEVQAPADEDDFKTDEELEEEQSDPMLYAGRDEITGY